jgi:hypothetical protein
MPVLVAIDNFNCLHNASSYYDMDGVSFKPELLMPNQLSVPQLFMEHDRQFLVNGTTVVSLTREGGKPVQNFEKINAKNVLKLVMKPYSLGEFETMFEEYGRMGLSSPHKHNRFGKKYMYAFTAGNPRELNKFVNYL